ncbi:hypothetical protein BU25DRAFT_115952 [Macroventuria anomochaeta]|uniref:Uncharacterized protein n=1 Tax=Macroventuria anomochaeta TaxID=301207 RepID=A0ACB6RUH4_9PLEO|nr:uncharacterized protein BU25DRAFT_115952 [Macroventuria anomochaeta]KAF2625571.1 hypothetical protein BU25DRAFT_115952 [Macroventuria anomochaeta]
MDLNDYGQMATVYSRADVSRLLHEYRVKPDPYYKSRDSNKRFGSEVLHSRTVFNLCGIDPGWSSRKGTMTMAEYHYNFSGRKATRRHRAFSHLIESSLAPITRDVWVTDFMRLCKLSSDYLAGSDLIWFRKIILQSRVSRFILQGNDQSLEWVAQGLRSPDGAPLLNTLRRGHCGLLKDIFDGHDLIDHELGGRFLSALRLLNIDIETCMSGELAHFLNYTHSLDGCLDRYISFQQAEDGRYTLDWDWTYNTEAPGYLAVSEFSALTTDHTYDRSSVSIVRSEATLNSKDLPFQDPYATVNRLHFRRKRKVYEDRTRRQECRKLPGSWIE